MYRRCHAVRFVFVRELLSLNVRLSTFYSRLGRKVHWSISSVTSCHRLNGYPPEAKRSIDNGIRLQWVDHCYSFVSIRAKYLAAGYQLVCELEGGGDTLLEFQVCQVHSNPSKLPK